MTLPSPTTFSRRNLATGKNKTQHDCQGFKLKENEFSSKPEQNKVYREISLYKINNSENYQYQTKMENPNISSFCQKTPFFQGYVKNNHKY